MNVNTAFNWRPVKQYDKICENGGSRSGAAGIRRCDVSPTVIDVSEDREGQAVFLHSLCYILFNHHDLLRSTSVLTHLQIAYTA